MMHNYKRALLIVDVQNGFCPGGNLPVPGGDEIVPIINAMTASGYYDLVIASQDWHPAGHGSFASSHPGSKVFEIGSLGGKPQVMWPDHCVQGTEDADFHPDLDTKRIDWFQRKGTDPQVDSYSAFRDNSADKPTGLAERLSSENIYMLDICGLATDFCVKATAVDAKEMLSARTHVRFIEDASRGIGPEGVSDAIAEMRKLGIEVVQSTVATSPTGHRQEHGFGELFHTAFRKGSDTKWSTILWNFINMLERLDEDELRKDRVWSHFVRTCAGNWHRGMKPSEAAKAWAILYDSYEGREGDPAPMSGRGWAFKNMIDLCDDQTWQDIDGSIDAWVDAPEVARRARNT